MLRRPPTRIELRPEDREEYEELKREAATREAAKVEVKLRLPNSQAHSKVAELLKPKHEATLFQENVFFDGAKKELSSNRVTMRIRFFNTDSKCVITVKGKSVLMDGIGTSPEEEEEIDPQQGRAYINDPSLLRTSGVPLIAAVRGRYNCSGFVCLGGFKNIRTVFRWDDIHKIELDETQFPFGTQYEIECESTTPEKLKAEIEHFLTANIVPFANSKASKFATFKAGQFLD